MSKILNDALSFLSSATQEQLEENWKHLEPYKNVGPKAEEFITAIENNSAYTI